MERSEKKRRNSDCELKVSIHLYPVIFQCTRAETKVMCHLEMKYVQRLLLYSRRGDEG